MKSGISFLLLAIASPCSAVGCGATVVGTTDGAHAGSGGVVGTFGSKDGGGNTGTNRGGRSGAQSAGSASGGAASGSGGNGFGQSLAGGVSLADGASGNTASGGRGGSAAVTPASGGAGTNSSAPPLVGGPCTALDATTTTYAARKTRTLVSPVPNVVGVAADSTSVWLLSATHGNALATITRYALPTQKILVQFQTRGWVLPSGSDFYGIEVSSDTIYISVAGTGPTDVSTLDAKTGEGTGDFESPFGWVPTGIGPSDLAFLDGKLLVGMGSGTLDLIQFPPGFTRESFTDYAPDSERDSGVATCNGFVLWGGLFEGITLLDRTGRAIGSVVHDDGQPFRQPDLGALAFFGNQLVIAAPNALAFYSLEAMP